MNDHKTTAWELKQLLLKFRDNRDWAQFHDPKNLAEAISIEASELLELFLWKDKSDVISKLNQDASFLQEVKDELADVLAYSLHMANRLDLDITEILNDKMKKNEIKYPIDKAKGNAAKYHKL